jgi:nucleoid-associated protein YgaU
VVAIVPEPSAPSAETVPAAREIQPQPKPQVAEIAPAAPVVPEPRPQAAEIAPAAPVVPEPRPQAAETAAVDKPAEGAGGQVAGGGQTAPEVPPAAAPEVASAAPVPLGVEAVEVEGGKLYAAGTAMPGAKIRLYIDGRPVGEATATDNGRWLLETEARVPAGTVTVRADQLAPGTVNVAARAEVPFTRQLDMAVLIPVASGGAPAGITAEGQLPKPNAVIIRRGDNLWTISRRTYGRGIRYTTIYTANRDQIRNPHLIYPGQVFLLPVGEKSWTQ